MPLVAPSDFHAGVALSLVLLEFVVRNGGIALPAVGRRLCRAALFGHGHSYVPWCKSKTGHESAVPRRRWHLIRQPRQRRRSGLGRLRLLRIISTRVATECCSGDYRFFVVRRDALRDLLLEDFRGGTFAPFSRASLSPIAIACLRLVTFRPELLFSVPFFFRRIVERTFFEADFPYFAMCTSPFVSANDVLRRGPLAINPSSACQEGDGRMRDFDRLRISRCSDPARNGSIAAWAARIAVGT